MGVFELVAPFDGDWYIGLAWTPRTSPGELYASHFWGNFFYNAETGYANSCGRTPITINGEDVSGIVVSILPELLTMIEHPLCNEGRPGFRMIRGTVFTPEGKPLTSHWPLAGSPEARKPTGYRYESRAVSVCLESKPSERDCSFAENIRDQYFIFYVPESSSFKLTVRVWDRQKDVANLNEYSVYESHAKGWHGDAGFTTNKERATVFEVNDADITGIEVRLPVGFLDLPPVAHEGLRYFWHATGW